MAIVSIPESQGYRAQNVLPNQVAAMALTEGKVVQLKPGTGKWELAKAGTATPKRGIVIDGGAAALDDIITVQVLDVVGGYPASTFTPGAVLFLDHTTDGDLTETRPPIADGKTTFVVGQALPNGTSFRLILETLESGVSPCVKVEQDDAQVLSRARTVNFEGTGLTVVDEGNQKATVKYLPEGTLGGGNILVHTFVYVGQIGNNWLGNMHPSMASDTSPLVIPYAGNIVGMTFVNEKNNRSMDFEIYKALYTAGASDTLEHTTEVRSARAVTDTSMNIPVAPGDKIAIKSVVVNNQKPSGVIISLYTKIDADAVFVNTSEDWTPDFS